MGSLRSPKPPASLGGFAPRPPDLSATKYACTTIIVHACTMIIVHAYFVADRSGGLGAKTPTSKFFGSWNLYVTYKHLANTCEITDVK